MEPNHWLATAKRDHGATMCGVRHGSAGELGAAAARRARRDPSRWMMLRAHAPQPYARAHALTLCVLVCCLPLAGVEHLGRADRAPPGAGQGRAERAHLVATGGECCAPMSVGRGVGVGCQGSPEAVGPRRPPMADDGRAPPAVSAATSAEGPLPSSRRPASVSPNVVAGHLPPCSWTSDPSVQCRVNPPLSKAHSINAPKMPPAELLPVRGRGERRAVANGGRSGESLLPFVPPRLTWDIATNPAAAIAIAATTNTASASRIGSPDDGCVDSLTASSSAHASAGGTCNARSRQSAPTQAAGSSRPPLIRTTHATRAASQRAPSGQCLLCLGPACQEPKAACTTPQHQPSNARAWMAVQACRAFHPAAAQ
eukprot:COSAG01_NODE_146_length_24099_cov_25.341208_38_plen_370_part_00